MTDIVRQPSRIRAVFFDIDGTLISYRTHAIPASTLRALGMLRDRGIRVMIASGRARYAMQEVEREFAFDAVAAVNGQLCYVGNEVVRRHPFSRADIQLLAQMIQLEDFPCMVVGEHALYLTGINADVQAHFTHVNQPVPPVHGVEYMLEHPVYQFVVYADESVRQKLLGMLTTAIPVDAAPMCLDVIPAGGGKSTGMRAILAHLGLEMAETMAFGDGGNDVDMLHAAGIGVAMGNADRAVQCVADYVTDTVDDDGIFNALRHFGLL